MKLLPAEISYGRAVKNENNDEKMAFFLRRFWVKEPRHSENILAKKRYTSIVACVRSTRVRNFHSVIKRYKARRLAPASGSCSKYGACCVFCVLHFSVYDYVLGATISTRFCF